MDKTHGPLTLLLTSRKVRCWTVAVITLLPVLYVLSFGPACWWFSTPPEDPLDIGYMAFQYHTASRLYWPIGWMAKNGPGPVRAVVLWYATRGIDHVMLPCNPSGTSGLGT